MKTGFWKLTLLIGIIVLSIVYEQEIKEWIHQPRPVYRIKMRDEGDFTRYVVQKRVFGLFYESYWGTTCFSREAAIEEMNELIRQDELIEKINRMKWVVLTPEDIAKETVLQPETLERAEE